MFSLPKNKKVFIILLLIICIGVLFRIEKDNNLQTSIKTDNPEITNILNKIEQILEKNKGQINETVKFSTNGTVSWLIPEEIKIEDQNSPSISFNFSNKNIETMKEFKLKIIPIIEKIFTDNGFSKKLPYSTAWYTYDVYEKNNTRCLMPVLINPDYNGGDLTVLCSDKYLEKYNLQAKILKDLGIKNNSLRLEGSKIVGKFAHFELGNGGVLAKMDKNNKWIALFEGLDPPPCTIVIENQIPKEIISDCYPEGEYTYTIPNPVKEKSINNL